MKVLQTSALATWLRRPEKTKKLKVLCRPASELLTFHFLTRFYGAVAGFELVIPTVARCPYISLAIPRLTAHVFFKPLLIFRGEHEFHNDVCLRQT
jgi:hypothetical protein